MSAYPLTKNQYRVVAKLGPGRSSMLFSFLASVADWTFRFLRVAVEEKARVRSSEPGSTDAKARAPTAAGRGVKAAATREHIFVSPSV